MAGVFVLDIEMRGIMVKKRDKLLGINKEKDEKRECNKTKREGQRTRRQSAMKDLE
jgi:hypothetical protein